MPILSPDDSPQYDRPFAVLASTLCGLLIGWALQTNHGNIDDWGMTFLSVALVFAVLAVASLRAPRLDRVAACLLPWVMGVGLCVQVALLNIVRPDRLVFPYDHPHEWLLHAETGALLVVGWLAGRPFMRGRRWLVGVMVCLAVLLGDWALVALHRLLIDVILVHREALAALLDGTNPFAITFPNMFPDDRYYGAGTVQNGRVMYGYDYPPINLLMALPGMLLGDYRYALVLAWALTAGLIASTHPGPRAMRGALLLLSIPGVLVLLAGSWIEPFGALLLALVLFCTVHGSRWMPIALGLLATSKQLMPLLVGTSVVALPAWRHTSMHIKRTIGLAVATATVVTLPFILWSPSAFWHSAIDAILRMPFRPDSLNYSAWIFVAQEGLQPPLPAWIGFVLAGLATALVFARAPRTLSGFCASLGLVYFSLLWVNRQAFYNYWWFIAVCMFASAAVGVFESDAEDARMRAAHSVAGR